MNIKRPKTCLLTVTNSCVLQCRMCHLWRLDTKNQEISIDDCKKFIDQLSGFGRDPIEVHIIGGESLIKKDIFELINYIRSKGSRTVITSSGYTIDEPTAKKIVDSGLSMLNLSLESLNPSVHDFLRNKPGCFGRVMKAIGHFNNIDRNGLRLGINSIISEVNLNDVVELAEWAQKKDELNSIYYMAVMRPFGSGFGWDWTEKEECKNLWPSDYKKVEVALNKLIELKKRGYKIENPIGQLESFKSYFKDPSKFVKIRRCNVSDGAVNVNAIGDIYICFFMEKLGNIKSDNIVRLWYSKKADEIRRKMHTCKNNCELVVNCYYENEN